MEGLRLNLYRAGPGQNNAFIMLMGDYVVVEFGVSGNACFIFRRDGLPFALEGYVAGDSSGLKHPSHIERLTHVDTRHGRWEKRFAAVLSKILPSRSERLAQTHSAPAASARGTPLTVNGVRIEPQFSAAALQTFVKAHGLQIIDHRGVSGALWVDTDNNNRVISEQLKAWGFRYSENKGRWWRQER